MLVQVPKLSTVESLMNAKRSIVDNGSCGKLLFRNLRGIEVWGNCEIHRSEVDF